MPNSRLEGLIHDAVHVSRQVMSVTGLGMSMMGCVLTALTSLINSKYHKKTHRTCSAAPAGRMFARYAPRLVSTPGWVADQPPSNSCAPPSRSKRRSTVMLQCRGHSHHHSSSRSAAVQLYPAPTHFQGRSRAACPAGPPELCAGVVAVPPL